jgi:hypothetical protein
MTTTGSVLPTVDWAGRSIARLLVGHNPVKGGSHFSPELDTEMREWHADVEHGLELLRRCEECGITTAQFGGGVMHRLIAEHARRGGSLQWIATLYANQQGNLGFGDQVAFEEELATILAVDPTPIGIQHFGESTDRLYFEGRMDVVRERMTRLRDTGRPIGVCSHLAEVIAEIESQDWDVDFYQTCFYTSYVGRFRKGVDRAEEVFDDADRDRMVAVIQQVRRPCLAFKVLGAKRKCDSDASVREALQFAFDHIKPTDVICVGMWQKHKDEVGQDTQFVREILG